MSRVPPILPRAKTRSSGAALAVGLTAVGFAMALFATPRPAEAQACLQLPVNCPISSAYGPRRNPITNTFGEQFHQGVDFACPIGTPLAAAAAGIITTHNTTPREGIYLGINGGDGMRHLYLHLSSVEAPASLAPSVVGRQVPAGQRVGATGNTGMSTGPHLHYQVQDGQTRRTVNPLPLFCSRPALRPGVMEGADVDATDLVLLGRRSTPPPQADVPPMSYDGSIEEIMVSILSTRVYNPDYVKSLGTLPAERLFAELAYLESISMVMSHRKMQDRMRISALMAVTGSMRAELLGQKASEQAAAAAAAGGRK